MRWGTGAASPGPERLALAARCIGAILFSKPASGLCGGIIRISAPLPATIAITPVAIVVAATTAMTAAALVSSTAAAMVTAVAAAMVTSAGMAPVVVIIIKVGGRIVMVIS